MEDPLMIDVPEGAVLVFGMRWFPLVGSRVDVLARKRAREARATHYVHGGTRAAAVGCARMRGRPRACYSAAQVFAHAHPHGIAAGLLLLDDRRTWLVASQDGAVMTRADRVYASTQLAMNGLAELDELYPGLSQGLEQLHISTLAANLDPVASLWQVGTRIGQIPGPVRVAAALLVVAVLAPQAWHAWHVWRARGAAHAGHAKKADPAQAWTSALSSYAASMPVHSSEQLGKVFGSLRQLPTFLRGWTLQSARCRPQANDWSCSASYGRIAPDATNREFAAAMPAQRRPVFKQLDQADLDWRVTAGPSLSVNPAALARPAVTDILFGSTLQRIRPAFAQIALSEPAALSVPAPVDAQGRPLPVPADLPRLRRRNLSLRGPLRSFALFAHPSATIAWSELVLSVGAVRVPTVGSSALTAQLHGVVYERE
jgi:hypothetical protein